MALKVYVDYCCAVTQVTPADCILKALLYSLSDCSIGLAQASSQVMIESTVMHLHLPVTKIDRKCRYLSSHRSYQNVVCMYDAATQGEGDWQMCCFALLEPFAGLRPPNL
jgi:hypothetical protein